MEQPLPLEGVRVLDLSTVLAAPVAATFLADFGADVVKVEEPLRGDFTRNHPTGGRSPHWVQEARGKRSVTCDLRRAEGQALVRELVPHFDVVVTNYRPPTLESWGLAPDDLLNLSPRTVVACVTAYGLTGPYRDRGAFDRVASAFSGLTYATGYPDAPPVRSGFAVIDYMSAYLAAFGIMVALYDRDARGGSGQIVDLALYEAGFRATEDALVRWAVDGTVRERIGNRNEQIVPATDVETADGRRVSVHAGTDPLFAKLVHVLARPELADDARFARRERRIEHPQEVYELLSRWAAARTASQVVEELSAAGVPAAPLMTIADIAEDEHYRERGSIVEVDDHEFGVLPVVAPLPHLSATPGRIRSNGPALGEANDEVYGGTLGLSAAAIRELRDTGVI